MEKKRQSIDFNDIWNIQSDMNVTNEDWDQIFHNWDDPDNCAGNKRPIGCSVCRQLEKVGEVTRKSDGKVFINPGTANDKT